MKHTLTLYDTECARADEAYIEMAVETGLASGPFAPDVYLALGEASYQVMPEDLVVLGRAMEAYLEQRRAVEVVEHQIHPHMQYTR